MPVQKDTKQLLEVILKDDWQHHGFLYASLLDENYLKAKM